MWLARSGSASPSRSELHERTQSAPSVLTPPVDQRSKPKHDKERKRRARSNLTPSKKKKPVCALLTAGLHGTPTPTIFCRLSQQPSKHMLNAVLVSLNHDRVRIARAQHARQNDGLNRTRTSLYGATTVLDQRHVFNRDQCRRPSSITRNRGASSASTARAIARAQHLARGRDKRPSRSASRSRIG